MKSGVSTDPFELHRKEFSYLHFDEAKWEQVKKGDIDSLVNDAQSPLEKMVITAIAICEGQYQHFHKLLDKLVLVLEVAVKLNKKDVVERTLRLVPAHFGNGEQTIDLCFAHAFKNEFWEIAEIFLKRFKKEISPGLKKMAFEQSLLLENYHFITMMAATNTLPSRGEEAALNSLNHVLTQRINLEENGDKAHREDIEKLKEKESSLFWVVHLCLKTTMLGIFFKTAMQYNFLLILECYLPQHADKLTTEDRKVIYAISVLKGATWHKVSEFLARSYGTGVLDIPPSLRFSHQEDSSKAGKVEPSVKTKATSKPNPF